MATKSAKAKKAKKAQKPRNAKKAKAKKANEEDWVTVNEAAELRGVSKSRIHQLISQGRLNREWKFGRAVLRRSEILELEELPRGRPPKE
jgi:excisionase family DNA binding protein